MKKISITLASAFSATMLYSVFVQMYSTGTIDMFHAIFRLEHLLIVIFVTMGMTLWEKFRNTE